MSGGSKHKLREIKGRWRFLIRAVVDLIGIVTPIKGYDIPQTSAGRKRILIFNWRDTRHQYAGGAEVYIHELSKQWAAEGNFVTMFCGADGRDAPRHEVIDGIHIIRRGGFWFVYVWAFFYYILRFRRRFDVIVDCHNGIPFFTPLYAREPVVCVVHHVHQEIFRKHLAPPLAKFAMWLEAYLMPRAYNQSQYVAVSPSTRTDMKDNLGIASEAVSLVYNGVDTGHLQPGRKAERPTVLYFGRLQAYKSVDVLIKAFRHVLTEVPQAKLVIAGSGEHLDALKDVVSEERLNEVVTFTGRVSNKRKLELMQQAWVSVNPSEMEGWGITTIEANACATPVIGSDVPGLRDSIRHNETGLLVPHGDVAALSNAITTLLTDHDARATAATRAHEWAQQFRWDSSARKMYGLLGTSERTDIRHADAWNQVTGEKL